MHPSADLQFMAEVCSVRKPLRLAKWSLNIPEMSFDPCSPTSGRNIMMERWGSITCPGDPKRPLRGVSVQQPLSFLPPPRRESAVTCFASTTTRWSTQRYMATPRASSTIPASPTATLASSPWTARNTSWSSLLDASTKARNSPTTTSSPSRRPAASCPATAIQRSAASSSTNIRTVKKRRAGLPAALPQCSEDDPADGLSSRWPSFLFSGSHYIRAANRTRLRLCWQNTQCSCICRKGRFGGRAICRNSNIQNCASFWFIWQRKVSPSEVPFETIEPLRNCKINFDLRDKIISPWFSHWPILLKLRKYRQKLRCEQKKKSKTMAPFYTKVQFVERTLKNNPFFKFCFEFSLSVIIGLPVWMCPDAFRVIEIKRNVPPIRRRCIVVVFFPAMPQLHRWKHQGAQWPLRGSEATGSWRVDLFQQKRVFLYLPDICGWYVNGLLVWLVDGISPLAWESEAARDSGGLTAEGPENPTDVL